MVSLMSAVMVVQTGLIYNVQNKTSIAKAAGAGAAAMLFIFEGAFTIGTQPLTWDLGALLTKFARRLPSDVSANYVPLLSSRS